jgi:hypothetical protein
MTSRIMVLLGVLILVIVANFSLYSCTNSDCVARGGHTEFVWGSHVQWVCQGAHG